MGNKTSSAQETAQFYDEESSRHVRFQVEVIPSERDSRIFRSFRTRPFTKKSNPEKRRSTTYDTANKTPWPHPQSDSLFLPEYEYKSAVQFNEYQIMENIGKGNFGHILKVKRKDTQEIFAMKVSNKSDIVRDNCVQQCKEEINIQKKLCENPFVTKLKCSWQTKHNLYVVTEFVRFGDLYSFWLVKKKFDENTVRLLGAEVALALDYFHSKGVIYRDLKMENILINKHGHIVITDFGLAKCLMTGEKTSTVTGTLKYMAPEMLMTEKYDHAIDWYALGAILCATLLSKFPYPVPVEQNEKQELLKQVSEEAGDVLLKLLEKDPKQRLRTLDAYKNHLFNQNISFEDVQAQHCPPFTEKLLRELGKQNLNEAHGKLQLRQKTKVQKQQYRPNSWASPENFRMQFDQVVKLGKSKELDGVAENTKF
ncbi:serine/threonine-protein kinase Sgk2-like [Xenia sp. Carnegie-2017]|uniref:serine/threonine-protein kinase Sgk2-like n=1 Tax=Xenia sp. Carnegie-2017 TaxID=2897299 RepID=UPI001F03A09C|nr:serine/threonine-protein kinase Sgk2-like [Xenia sp. Carnegie-2017]